MHFYQVAAAQDKLVNYNMSYIKRESPLLMELSYFINHVLLSLISVTGVVQFLKPCRSAMALHFCGLLDNATKFND